MFGYSSQAHVLSDTSTYTGNGEDVVPLEGYSLDLGGAVTWDAIDVPYRVTSETAAVLRSPTTIAAGTTVQFEKDASMKVVQHKSGSLTAAGTEEEQIAFTGTEDARGHWIGINFDGGPEDTPSEKNELVHCVVEHAGGASFTGAEAANVPVTNGAALEVADSTLRHGAGWGLFLDSNVDVGQSGNTYENNASGDVNE